MKDECGDFVGLPERRGSWKNGMIRKELAGTEWEQVVEDLAVIVPGFKGDRVRKTKEDEKRHPKRELSC